LIDTDISIAPEILLGVGHGMAVDWWSLGVVMFELLCGSKLEFKRDIIHFLAPPFMGENVKEIFKLLMSKSIPWERLPPNTSKEAIDLLGKLLVVDQERRLGYNGAHEIKSHVFFQGIDWEHILSSGKSEPVKFY
jgi:serine/threonine protein kinase